MKKLIEFKLHAGAFPYFVDDIIGGVDIAGKRYGISRDTGDCYLPDTVVTLTPEEFTQRVISAEVLWAFGDFDAPPLPMTAVEKEAFARDWLERHSILVI